MIYADVPSSLALEEGRLPRHLLSLNKYLQLPKPALSAHGFGCQGCMNEN